MADEPQVVEVRKVRIEYEITVPNVPAVQQPNIDPAALERFVLAVMAKSSLSRTSL